MRIKKKTAAVLLCLTALCIAMLPVFVMAKDYEPSEFDDWEYFYSFNNSIIQRHAHPQVLLNLPIIRQATSYTNGAACVMSVLSYANYGFDIRESELADALGANEDEGVMASEMVDYLNAARLDGDPDAYFSAEFRQGMTLSDLKAELDNGRPVICAIQAWNWNDEDGSYSMDLDYTDEWECGHWVVAVGYNNNNVFFMDPSTAANYTYIPNNKLMERWHDYEGTELTSESRIVQAGIVVKLLRDEVPDGERYKDAFYGLPRNAGPRTIMKLPLYRQSKSYTDGPACMLSVMRYAGYYFDIREDNMELALSADAYNGVNPSKMVRYLNAVRLDEKEDQCFDAELKKNMSLDELKNEIGSGHPVICAIQPVDNSGGSENGHWAVAMGYDADNIFFMDPSTAAGYTYLSNNDFTDKWDTSIGAEGQPATEYKQAGIIVEICGDQEPDCVRYKDAFYGLM